MTETETRTEDRTMTRHDEYNKLIARLTEMLVEDAREGLEENNQESYRAMEDPGPVTPEMTGRYAVTELFHHAVAEQVEAEARKLLNLPGDFDFFKNQ
jgi:hypothetical protein